MMRAVFLAACLGIASAELALQIANDGSYAIDGYSIALKSGPTMFGVRPVFRSRLVCARERATHARAVIGSPGWPVLDRIQGRAQGHFSPRYLRALVAAHTNPPSRRGNLGISFAPREI